MKTDFTKDLRQKVEKVTQGCYVAIVGDSFKVTLSEKILANINLHVNIIKELKEMGMKNFDEYDDVSEGKAYLTFVAK